MATETFTAHSQGSETSLVPVCSTHITVLHPAHRPVDGKYHTEYKDEAAERLREIVITQLAESRAGT